MFRKPSHIWIAVSTLALIIGVVTGLLISSPRRTSPPRGALSPSKNEKKTIWTCSMHPQVRRLKPGKCPICFMDLIPLKENSTGSNESNVPELKLSPRAIQLAEIQTVPARRKVVAVKIRMVGKVDFDESRISYITARMPGRIDKLYVNYTGIPVRKGDHMAAYFSVDLMLAQKELLIVLDDMKHQREPKYTRETLESVLKKFKLWGLTRENVIRVARSGKVLDHLILYAPASGIVIEKNALEGKYFNTGDRLFTIADLSKVWIEMEAYESDLSWLRYGQKVSFTTSAYPDEVFHGRIAFINPVLDEKTRTVNVRVDAPNPNGKLKPGMFVNAVVSAKVSQGGKVIDPSLNNKWISPMHPEIIKDKPGKCDICGMKLVRAETLGYATIDPNQKPLVIPETAPLITGKRAVVYLKSKKKPGTYYGKEIVLGPRAGKYYIVKSGLKEGDQVVVNGNFKIDSALQILAKPSMMTEPGDDEVKTHKTIAPQAGKTITFPKQFILELDPVYSAYFGIQKNLAKDNFNKALGSAKRLGQAISSLNVNNLTADQKQRWLLIRKNILAACDDVSSAKNINEARNGFSSLSTEVYILAKKIGTSGKLHIYRFFCPMAFDNKGAHWLQNNKDIANPYFGKVMLKCGEKTENIAK
ncbi:MAG: DUF3347 domain-containing protein [Lentisphaerae bacterium]|nr:DUF3347 domain-containing protein [Lentisphaerota bacterium]MCP4100719.1 DUF3347 domain-containing protein [Lentisphaerota bacterium]